MKKVATLMFAGILGAAVQVSAQAPAAPAQPKASTTPKTGTAAKTGAATPRAYDRVLLRPALLKEKAPATYQVKFSTTRGDFTVTVTRAWAPIGADRFFNLVKHHFYDNASFFRVVPNFVVQFGLSAYPPVSAAWSKANLIDDPVSQTNKMGYLTFATAGPNTRTTQVFINLKDNARLDGMGFAPFAVVDGEGMKVVEMLYDQYGDSAGPDQELIEKQGKPYIDKGWPKLDSIRSATLIGAAATTAPAATAKPATKTAPVAKAPSK
jgi:peptidyl-prolyl cis-trans isomerase A (cyclophilin A)